jgi:hypothetical protein
MVVVAATMQAACHAELGGEALAMPNPWHSEGIQTTSKRYLERLYEASEVTNDLLTTVAGVCKGIVAEHFAATGMTVEAGPLKCRDRVFEKVLLKHGDFGAIFDYARLAFLVPKVSLIPRLLTLLLKAEEFKFVRCKNRLDPALSAYDSGGYRDCQCLVRVPSGWIVEIQIIPTEIYKVQKRCGHGAYKEHRFVLEARKRAQDDSSLNSEKNVHSLVTKIMKEQAEWRETASATEVTDAPVKQPDSTSTKSKTENDRREQEAVEGLHLSPDGGDYLQYVHSDEPSPILESEVEEVRGFGDA